MGKGVVLTMIMIIKKLVFIGLATALAFQLSTNYRDARVEEVVRSELDRARDIVFHDLEIRINAVERMGSRFEDLGTVTDASFSSDAQNYINDMPGFLAWPCEM